MARLMKLNQGSAAKTSVNMQSVSLNNHLEREDFHYLAKVFHIISKRSLRFEKRLYFKL